MSVTYTSNRKVIIYDVNESTSDGYIYRKIQECVPGISLSINRGNPYALNGEQCQNIFVTFDSPASVDEFMKCRPFFLHKKIIRVARLLPKTCHLYNRFVRGLKVRIHPPGNDQRVGRTLNEADLTKRFQQFGTIVRNQWNNQERTEALFVFDDYDAVDRIILDNQVSMIRGVKVDLEKTQTAEDYVTCNRPYVIHVTNLPVRITSQELSNTFNVPVAGILLYPCFKIEQTNVKGGRSSSEAWIKDVGNENNARTLAKEKSDTIVRGNKIQCEAILEPIYEEELCEGFQNGTCLYSAKKCFFKHYSCPNGDNCQDEHCWLGHSEKRVTVSVERPQYRLEHARYRIKIGNLPSHVTHDELMHRLKIDSRNSRHLILEDVETASKRPKCAYLIRQRFENKLRQELDQWHNKPYSPQMNKTIQCQLEINHDYYEWNESDYKTCTLDNNTYSSPAPSIYSSQSINGEKKSWASSSVSKTSYKTNEMSTRRTTVQADAVLPSLDSNVSQKEQSTTSLRLKSVIVNQPSPWNDPILNDRWAWTSLLIPKGPFDEDEMYWIDSTADNQKDVITKIYLTQNNLLRRVRAQRERAALERFPGIRGVPKLLENNIDESIKSEGKNSSHGKLWLNMKIMDGNRLIDYIKSDGVDLYKAVRISQKLLTIIRKIHSCNVIHRNIQPKNILIRPSPKNDRFDLMMIDFTLAWIENHQMNASTPNVDEPLGNHFHWMPQFEKWPDQSERTEEKDLEVLQHQRSPTIDATGVCAILFWLITHHEPKESKDVSGYSPHQLNKPNKLIQEKIKLLIGFQTEKPAFDCLKKRLIHVFDRGFAEPKQQWSVDELDYELRFILSLWELAREESKLWPVSDQQTNADLLLPFIPPEDPFVGGVVFINTLKQQLAKRYSDRIRWSNTQTGNWNYEEKRIRNFDKLSYHYETRDISFDVIWTTRLLEEQKFSVGLIAKLTPTVDFEIFLGIFNGLEKTNQFDVAIRHFEFEIKALVNMLWKSTQA